MDFNQCIKDDTLVLTHTAVNVSELVSFLQNNTYITKLSLSGLRHRISHEDVRELAKLTNLTSLHLRGCYIGSDINAIHDKGVKELTKLTNLTSLNLSHNNISDEGAKELAKLTNLTSLVLSENKIGDKGARELAKLANLTSLIS